MRKISGEAWRSVKRIERGGVSGGERIIEGSHYERNVCFLKLGKNVE